VKVISAVCQTGEQCFRFKQMF